ncbi:MAG: endolytic transglycosylase MltG [Chloroflexi bacterium]|nr:endolytic transglycosylase MltG [Chloroflexota bacterium]
MSRKKRRSRIYTVFLLPFVALGCLIIFFFISLPGLTQQASEVFGQASEQLSAPEKVYFSIILLSNADSLTQPANKLGVDTPFQVEIGESPNDVSRRLESRGLISDASAFRAYLIYTGVDMLIQAGEYTLNPSFSPLEIASILQDSTPSKGNLTIFAGWRLEEIGAALPTSGLALDPEAFIARAQQENTEGYLLPGTYSLPRSIRPEALILILGNAFVQAISYEINAGIEQQGISLDQAVILASIVEREAVVDDEMPLIASVFLNRLNADIKLDADPTVQYAIGYSADQTTWWTNPLSFEDLQFDSPYNTYLYAGLPPGPICNPSIDALRSVAFPAQTPYYFFRAACDGSGRHLFAETFEEHKNNACQ